MQKPPALAALGGDTIDTNPDDPVGTCPAVQSALLALDAAVDAACTRAGREPKALAVIWVTEAEGDGYCGMLGSGDLSGDVVQFMAETLLDDTCDLPTPSGLGGRMQ